MLLQGLLKGGQFGGGEGGQVGQRETSKLMVLEEKLRGVRRGSHTHELKMEKHRWKGLIPVVQGTWSTHSGGRKASTKPSKSQQDSETNYSRANRLTNEQDQS